MILITTYYEDKNIERRQELLDCLTNNSVNPIISEIHLICENVMPPIESSDKMVFVLANIRWTFKELIKYANKLGNKEIKIIANTDIYFNHTLAFANKIKFNEVFCLTRWDFDAKEDLKFYENFKSQDAWIFHGKLPENIGNYYMGLPGCDNRFAKELLDSGHKIYNPSLSIKAIHMHGSNLRNYHKVVDRVLGKYAYPLPVEFKSHKTQWGQIKENDLRLKFLHRKWRNNLDGTSYTVLERLMAKINSFYLKYFIC